MGLDLERRSDSTYAVGSFAAKTYFAELLRKVEEGVVITITRSGHDVAVIHKPEMNSGSKALEAWNNICKSLRKEGNLKKSDSAD